jgi:hypothetical protein
MRSMTGDRSSPPAASLVRPRAVWTAVLSWLAVTGIGSSILIMIAASLIRSSWMYPPVVMPALGPPWDIEPVQVSPSAVIVALWTAVILGAVGVAAGLAAVQRGARYSLRALLIVAALVVIVLTVLLPAGSTDAFDYATYGRIVTLGHSPYVMTPYQLTLVQNAFSESVPVTWQHNVSVYGPFATVEQFLAAKLGGISAARIIFWLKLWNSVAFAIVAFVMDRLLRSDPARRLRAHLLWTINPLLLWDLVAAGHVDVLAAAAGMLGLLALGEHSAASRPPMRRVLAAGALIGVAADIKINYALFGLGLAWALRRAPRAQAAAAAAALVMLLPGYLWFGPPAAKALVDRRNGTSADNFYRFFIVDPHWRAHLSVVAVILVVAVALLALRRLPEGAAARPAIRPALALSAAWLFFWPYQLPWYDAMIICLLVFYPASRLDWLVIARLAAGTVPNIPGNPKAPGGVVGYLHHLFVVTLAPIVLLVAAVGLVTLCLSGWWKRREPGGQPVGPPAETVGLVPAAAAVTARVDAG